MKGSILFLLPDCPGYYTELCYHMGLVLKQKGYTPLFAATTPFYERFKKIDLSEVGKVFYLDEFLQQDLNESEYENYAIDNWSYYASFSRQTYYFKKQLNNISVFKKTKLFFDKIIKQNNVDILFSEIVSNSFLYLAHQQASANNIPFFGLLGARIPSHYNIHIDVVGNQMLLNKKAPETYVPTDEVLDYMKSSQFGGLFDRKSSMTKPGFLKELFQFLTLRSVNSFETGNTKWFLLKVYRIAFKRIFADKLFRNVYKIFEQELDIPKEKIAVVYPLHVYPEASTSVFAKYYDGNDYNLIQNIAFSLPTNAVLVVKEHKNNVGTHSLEFYRKIKKLPNVILLDPYYKLKDNLEKFDAVVTLSSTVGFEALTMNIPVYTLGEVSYQNYPGSIKIRSYTQLEEELSKIHKRRNTNEQSQAYNIYAKVCFPGNFNYMDVACLNPKNLELLVEPITDFLNSKELTIYHNDKK
jgi:CDP-glycerol glycerophosphotransferase (TagB/SpsB family)